MLGVAAGVVPWTLLAAAAARFGGRSPLSGVPPPTEWRLAAIRRALSEPLTEDTLTDVVARAALLVAWAAVAVFVTSVVVEVVHMVRHDGLPTPAVRGFGWSQAAARVVATGLLVVLPPLHASSRASARDVLTSTVSGPAATVVEPVTGAVGQHAPPDPTERAPATTSYVVQPGDSVFGIAARLAGSDPAAVHAFADEVLDLNLGRTMPDGRRFDNAALLQVGWVLELPVDSAHRPAAIAESAAADGAHVVASGDTLWSIADDVLGAGARWAEIFDLNAGRTFGDGRTLHDPSLIHPGWELDVPGQSGSAAPPPDDPDVETPLDDVAADDAPVADAPARAAGDTTGDQAADDALVDDAPGTVAGDAPTDPARPINRWVDVVPTATLPGGSPNPVGSADPAPLDGQQDESSAGPAAPLLAPAGAAMLSAGVLALVAVRRRDRLRRARPRTALAAPSVAVTCTERALRSIAPDDRLLRVDVAIRSAAMALIAAEERVVTVAVDAAGEVELHASGSVRLAVPWCATQDPSRWRLAATVPIEQLSEPARRVGAPCPTLIQLGRTTDDRDLFVDLEALEALEIGGSGERADAIVRAIAATLAGSVFAEVTTLIGVGVADAAFLGHRHHVPARDAAEAFDRARSVFAGTAATHRSTFELRARATGGETWEPAVVLAAAATGVVTPPADRAGLAVVSAAPIHGPSSRLEPDGDAWVLRPLGVRCVPVGVAPGDLDSLAALLATTDPDRTLVPVPEVFDRAGGADPSPVVDPDDTADGPPPVRVVLPAEPPGAAILVCLLGPIAVRSADGRVATFEKSKARELVAWLATHRERATRRAARTAMWELDVRDATFANVVSDARRALARLVPPPDGAEWIGRTLTEALPLHDGVRTDADLVRDGLERSRTQPPEQAIATLRPVVDLVVGVPFEGTDYLWPDAEGITSGLVLLATSVTTELAERCLAIGDVHGVFDATARGLQVLPGHEGLIALRMRAHARAGDQAGVRHEWEQYQRVITADPWSDGEPAPELLDLRRQLLAR